MPWINRIALAAALAGASAATAIAAAEPKGQADLDKAFEARLTAKSLNELSEIVSLCRSALDKGLDAENEKFAKQLLASSLFQRGQALADGVLNARRPDPRLPELRSAALRDLEDALKYDAELPQAQLLIAELSLVGGGDAKRARAAVDAVIESKSAEPQDRAKAFMLRSALREKPTDRLADLDEAIRLNAGDPKPLRLRGALKLSLDKPAEAVADFDAALKLAPDDAATHEARGLALAAQRNWAEAKKSLSRAAELAPQSTAALLQRGQVSLIMGDHKAALADAEAALKAVPDLPTAMILRSRAYFAAGEKEKALADVDQVLKKFPDAVEALRVRAVYRLDADETDAAISDLEALRRLVPDDMEVAIQLAVSYSAQKNTSRAVETVDAVLKADPKNWRALRIRGDAYLNVGKQAEAIADYEAALKIEPKDTGLLNNLAWVLATSPDDKLRDAKRSIELGEAACRETEYKEAHILSTLAAGYAEKGDFETAQKWSQKAIEAAQSDAEREALRKELESYKSKKPWRELLTGAVDKPQSQRK